MSSFSLNNTTIPPPSHHPLNFTLINTTSPSLFAEQTERGEAAGSSYTPTCCFKLNPPFDSAMALTVLLLITALFFMAFFSVYVRRFADDSSVDPTRRRRSRTPAAPARGVKGVDHAVVELLPSYVYDGGDLEKGSDDVVVKECAICLGEFEVKDLVKEIPYCGHVFHMDCIDLWLASHVTCPLCRTTHFFQKDVGDEIRFSS